MKDHGVHDGGSPGAPVDESLVAQEEDAGETEDKEGFESALEGPGGTRTVWFGWGWGGGGVGVFLFLLSGGYGEKEIRELRFDSQ